MKYLKFDRPQGGAGASKRLGRSLLCILVHTIYLSALFVKTEASSSSNQLQLNHRRQYHPLILNAFERRSTSYIGGSGSQGFGYTGTIGGGGKTQVAISLERVKNPDDEYPKKKKKFPITWLRNQYPFNSHSSKKKAKEPLEGQYSSVSSQAVEFLDPNPSTWVKIPNRPTASIKFQKQSSAVPLSLQPNEFGFIQPPASLVPPEVLMSPLASQQMGMERQPQFNYNLLPRAPASNPMMTSESQNEYVSSSSASEPAQGGSYAPAAGGEAPSSGFGGISLSFGNGRSISFGGGQGLTIGGRAGAISIGGKGGNDNYAAASGYSETKGGASSQSSYQPSPDHSYQPASTGGQGSADYGDKPYVNKHPTMSIDMPRKGKTIVHANLDMAPTKFRLHASPRIKITTGSRDPLEKPSDEELSENEEDIFEPPEPFPKLNTTTSANETAVNAAGANSNATETTTLSPFQIQQMQLYGDGKTNYAPAYNQYHQHHHHHHHHHHQQQQQQQQQYYQQHQQNPNQQVPFDDVSYQQHQRPSQQQFNQNQNVPFDEPPAATPPQEQQPPRPGHQSQSYNQPQPFNQPQYQQFREPNRAPPVHFRPEQQQVEPVVGAQPELRPAVSQWRAFSGQARQQMSMVPKQEELGLQHEGRFYQSTNSIEQSPRPQQSEQRPPAEQQPGPEGRETVDLAASSDVQSFAKLGPASSPKAPTGQRVAASAKFNPEVAKFDQTTAYQVGGPERKEQAAAAGAERSTKLLSQESNNYREQIPHRGYQQTGGSSYGSSGERTRTFTFGRGGFSSSYGSSGSSSSGYSTSGHGGEASSAPACSTTDCFDQKNYAGKVEKFDPDAHDKRERSKVVMFLRPRISIHSANSSTTTRRPKNQQRFFNVITKPIFLNSTGNGSHHEDEEFIDPDLREPMDVAYGHNYGYGYGYSRNYYNASATSSTTKKPKRTTTSTTTSTTTAAPTEAESTTSSPTTTASSSSTSSESEPTTTTSTEAPSSSTSTESSSSSSTSAPSSSTAADDGSEPSTTREGDKEATTTESPAEEAGGAASSTAEPTSKPEEEPTSEPTTTQTEASSTARDEPEAAATEASKLVVTTTTSSTTKASIVSRAPPRITTRTPTPSPSPTTTTTSTTTTTTSAPEETTTAEPAATTTVQASPPTSTTTTSTTPPESSSEEAGGQQQDNDTSATTAQLPGSSQPQAEAAGTESPRQSTALQTADDEFIAQSQKAPKRRTRQEQAGHKPMLLSPELIEKLMSNKTLVGLMSSQLRRVIDTERMAEEEKRRIVRQVFEQMMEERVDFSMNNVRLAVKTVSSSYRAAAEKQRKKNPKTESLEPPKKRTVERKQRRSDSKSFGRRAASRQGQESGEPPNRALAAVETALRPTGTQKSSSEPTHKTSGAAKKLDAAGNPIVVVLLPQGRRKA